MSEIDEMIYDEIDRYFEFGETEEDVQTRHDIFLMIKRIVNRVTGNREAKQILREAESYLGSFDGMEVDGEEFRDDKTTN